MEQQTLRIRQILNQLPKALLIEMILAQESEPVSQTVSQPSLFEPSEPSVNHQFKHKRPRTSTTRRKWTREQDEALVYAIKQGRKSYAEIGQLLGRTNKAVCQRAVILRSRGQI